MIFYLSHKNKEKRIKNAVLSKSDVDLSIWLYQPKDKENLDYLIKDAFNTIKKLSKKSKEIFVNPIYLGNWFFGFYASQDLKMYQNSNFYDENDDYLKFEKVIRRYLKNMKSESYSANSFYYPSFDNKENEYLLFFDLENFSDQKDFNYFIFRVGHYLSSLEKDRVVKQIINPYTIRDPFFIAIYINKNKESFHDPFTNTTFLGDYLDFSLEDKLNLLLSSFDYTFLHLDENKINNQKLLHKDDITKNYIKSSIYSNFVSHVCNILFNRWNVFKKYEKLLSNEERSLDNIVLNNLNSRINDKDKNINKFINKFNKNNENYKETLKSILSYNSYYPVDSVIVDGALYGNNRDSLITFIIHSFNSKDNFYVSESFFVETFRYTDFYVFKVLARDIFKHILSFEIKPYVTDNLVSLFRELPIKKNVFISNKNLFNTKDYNQLSSVFEVDIEKFYSLFYS